MCPLSDACCFPYRQLLMGLKIMDYSLLIGIHKHAELASPTTPDAASALASPVEAASPGPALPAPVQRPSHDPSHGVGSDSDTEGPAHTRPSSDPGARTVPPPPPPPLLNRTRALSPAGAGRKR